MKEQMEATALADTREVLITRIYDAPPGLLFEAWSDPEYLKHWYAPEGCKVEIYKLDFRKDGRFVHSIQISDGSECVCTGMYHEIVEPKKIVYSLFFSDKEGNIIEPDYGLHP